MIEIRYLLPHQALTFAQLLKLPTADGLRGLCSVSPYGVPHMVIAGNNWTENSAHVHQWCAHPRYYSRALVRAFAQWVYAPAGANRGLLLAPVRGDEPDTLRLNVRLLGFRVTCTIPDVYEVGVPMHLLTLRREDCRFIGSNWREFRPPAAWLNVPLDS